jgi:hypothetical protein
LVDICSLQSCLGGAAAIVVRSSSKCRERRTPRSDTTLTAYEAGYVAENRKSVIILKLADVMYWKKYAT